jgi:uncharacterized membrane protein
MRHPLWSALLLLLLLIPMLLLFAYFGLAADAFRLLGLSRGSATILLTASLIGSTINIPLTRTRIVLDDPRVERLPAAMQWLVPLIHYYPPAVVQQVLAINVGGAIVPLVFSIHLLLQASTSVGAAIAATLVVAAAARLLARPVPGQGITLPALVPSLVAALAARGFVHVAGLPISSAAPVAYIAGTMGCLLGADLLTLPATLGGRLVPADAPRAAGGNFVISIGGAGVFDGIFLAGIVAPFLATI